MPVPSPARHGRPRSPNATPGLHERNAGAPDLALGARERVGAGSSLTSGSRERFGRVSVLMFWDGAGDATHVRDVDCSGMGYLLSRAEAWHRHMPRRLGANNSREWPWHDVAWSSATHVDCVLRNARGPDLGLGARGRVGVGSTRTFAGCERSWRVSGEG